MKKIKQSLSVSVTLILALFILLSLTNCVDGRSMPSETLATADSKEIVEGEFVLEQSEATNQFNNLLSTGFALALGDDIFLADGAGIHKTDSAFSHRRTLVFNENYYENLRFDRTAFNRLQHDSGRIFFNDETNEIYSLLAIYSMYPDGSGLERVLGLERWPDSAHTGEFLVKNEIIYFTYHGNLMAFDIPTGETVNFDINLVSHLTVCTARNALQFSHFCALALEERWGFLCFNSHFVEFSRPSNLAQFQLEKDFVGISHTTNSNGRLVLVKSSMLRNSRIFILNDDGDAEEIYQSSGHIKWHVNSICDWIYFALTPENDRNVHLYRVNNSGSKVELILANIAYHTDYVSPFPFINILSENLILVKMHPIVHTIYAVIWDASIESFTIQAINNH